MLINEAYCTGCEQCLLFCPVGAIKIAANGKAVIDRQLCCECGACIRLRVFKCPTDAIIQDELDKPAIIARNFSDPTIYHRKTGVPGRGAEEVKTNDVTGIVKKGEVGIAVEIGRPCIGAKIGLVETFVHALRECGVEYEKLNPIYEIIGDLSGDNDEKEKIKDQYLISAIIQLKVPVKGLKNTLDAILKVSTGLDTVFSMSLISRFEDGFKIPDELIVELKQLGLDYRPNAKVNLGLGKPLITD